MEDDGHEFEAQRTGAGTVRLTLDERTFAQKTWTNKRTRRASQQPTSAPSGIAKLRESVDLSSTPDPDPMNIDDFIFPASIASPAGMSPSSSPPSSNVNASAIPIKTKRDSQHQIHPEFPPSAPTQDRIRDREFDYVQRRVRKTSIDETKVHPLSCDKPRWSSELLTMWHIVSKAACRVFSPSKPH